MQSQDRIIKLLPVQGQTRKNMVLKRKLGKSPGFFFAPARTRSVRRRRRAVVGWSLTDHIRSEIPIPEKIFSAANRDPSCTTRKKPHENNREGSHQKEGTPPVPEIRVRISMRTCQRQGTEIRVLHTLRQRNAQHRPRVPCLRLDAAKREQPCTTQNKTQMNELIKKYKELLDGYRNLVSEYEAKGIENLDFEDTENYGAYLGKIEILEEIIKDLTILKM
jgi:hypothetical protein